MTKRIAAVLLYSCLMLTAPLSFADTLSQALNPQVSVSGEMTTQKLKILLAQGFKSVIVNRPDQESGNLTSVSELRNLAEKSHVSLIYQPVISGHMTASDAQEFAKYYNSLPKPILLVCKSGTRSTLLFNQAKSLGLLNE